MNKKLIFSIAAAAALLVSTPGMNKAEAASPAEVQSKVYVYHAGQKLDQQQVNELIQKYMTNLKGNQTIQQPVKEQPKQNNQLKNQFNSLYRKNPYKQRSLKQQHLLLLQ